MVPMRRALVVNWCIAFHSGNHAQWHSEGTSDDSGQKAQFERNGQGVQEIFAQRQGRAQRIPQLARRNFSKPLEILDMQRFREPQSFEHRLFARRTHRAFTSRHRVHDITGQNSDHQKDNDGQTDNCGNCQCHPAQKIRSQSGILRLQNRQSIRRLKSIAALRRSQLKEMILQSRY